MLPIRRPAIIKPTLGETIAYGNPLAQGLIGSWVCNDGAGTVVSDATGRYGNGTLQGGASWETGTQGLDLKISSASSQYIQIPNNASYPLVNGFDGPCAFTAFILVWLNSNRSYNGLVSKTNNNVPAPFDSYVDSGGTIHFYYGNGSSNGNISASGMPVGQWVQVVITGDTQVDISRIYLNGVQVANGTFVNVADLGTAIRLGNRNDNATYLDGKIGASYLWNRAITLSEVQALAVNPWQVFQGTDHNILTSGHSTTITTTQTQTGVARIQITTPQTQTGNAAIQNTTTQTQSGVARLQYSSYFVQLGSAAIQNTTTQTQSGVARIQITTPQTQLGVSRIQITTDQIQVGQGTIQNTTTRTQTGNAAIRNTTTQTQSGVSLIQLITVKTQIGAADIQNTTPQTIAGVSRIQVTTNQTQSGTARLQYPSYQTQFGIATIQNTTTQTQVGVSRIQITTPQTQSGISTIEVQTNRTQIGSAAIQNTTVRTQSGSADIQNTTVQTQIGTANLIFLISDQTQLGVSRIQVTTPRTQIGSAAIQNTTVRTQVGNAAIQNTTVRTQAGVSTIVFLSVQTQSGVSRIQLITPRTQSGNAAIQNLTTKTLSGTAAVQNTTQKTQTGVSSIVPPALQDFLNGQWGRYPFFVREAIDITEIGTGVAFTLDGITAYGGMGVLGEDKEEYVIFAPLTNARLTQQIMEVLATGIPSVRMTQANYEMLWIPASYTRCTQVVEEVLYLANLGAIQQAAIETLAGGDGGECLLQQAAIEAIYSIKAYVLMTQMTLEALQGPDNPNVRMTQTIMEVLSLNQIAQYASANIQQVAIAALHNDNPDAHIQQVAVENLFNNQGFARIQQAAVETLGTGNSNARLQQVAIAELNNSTTMAGCIQQIAVEMLVRPGFDGTVGALISNPHYHI